MKTRFLLTIAVAVIGLIAGCATHPGENPGSVAGPLTIQAQGSFAVGGTVLKTPGTYDNNKPTVAGQSFHGDHL